jgi:alanyl-tRNA synthetase
MEALTCAGLRKLWIDFFTTKKHLHLPSASLLPVGDPTLLFTSAGMVPFKAFFEGTEVPPAPRIATIQKCLRTTDLEVVGKTARHCTFFEMLGNFSFGDYFKEEAIEWAWEFSVDWLKLDPEKIHITVYEEDDEALQIWHEKVGVPLERITRLGKDTNWWGPAGDSGPCGPCSELYLDRGDHICRGPAGCGNPEKCRPGSDCDRFLEYWNLVFNQYNQDTSGKLHPLPKKGIDTGAGLERIVALLNNTDTVYETDELVRIRKKVEELVLESTGRLPEINETTLSAFRVLTDHVRSSTFALSDGILPDNSGRGYVIRRIIRRALLFAHHLGVHEPILHRLHPEVVSIYGSFYPELVEQKKKVHDILLSEEQRFLSTLETGVRKWEEFLAEAKASQVKVFPGKQAFLLYDTFGFPLEMTVELAERNGMQVDTGEFERLMEEQREKARTGAIWKDFKLPADFPITDETRTEFVGYETLSAEGIIIGMIAENQTVSQLSGEGMVVTSQSPFYPEGGGQLGDTGFLVTAGARFRVEDTRKKGELILHIGRMEEGTLRTGDRVELRVDTDRRNLLIRHHSATHLLNSGLRSVLGTHILQTGSLVAPDYLRFDFSHPKRMEPDEIEKVERSVIRAIKAKAEVEARVLPIEEAKKTGAIATFGEKYGEMVRVVLMGAGEKDGPYSIEFCGGCHVKNTGDIGLFHILRESSPGAGNRRIEAVAGNRVIAWFDEQFKELRAERDRLLQEEAAAHLQAEEKELRELSFPDRQAIETSLIGDPEQSIVLEKMLRQARESLKSIEKRIRKASAKGSFDTKDLVDSLLARAAPAGNFKVVMTRQDQMDGQALKALADALRERESKLILLAGSVTEKGPVLVYSCTAEAVKVGLDCSELIRQTSSHIGGRGGGKKDMAQAGGTLMEGIEKALAEAAALVSARLAGK